MVAGAGDDDVDVELGAVAQPQPGRREAFNRRAVRPYCPRPHLLEKVAPYRRILRHQPVLGFQRLRVLPLHEVDEFYLQVLRHGMWDPDLRCAV